MTRLSSPPAGEVAAKPAEGTGGQPVPGAPSASASLRHLPRDGGGDQAGEVAAKPPEGTERRLKGTVMDADGVRRSLQRIAHEIVERNHGVEGVVVVGIVSQGDVLAARLAAMLQAMEGRTVPCGRLDPAAHRDDRHLRPASPDEPVADVPEIDGRTVVLVDDVIWHGRTARAALDALMEHGRPRAVQLAVLVDRGHRELPIRPDYVGKNIATAGSDRVDVCLAETEGIDAVVVLG